MSIDPRRAFGRPTIADRSLTVEVITDRFKAGDSIELLVKGYKLSKDQGRGRAAVGHAWRGGRLSPRGEIGVDAGLRTASSRTRWGSPNRAMGRILCAVCAMQRGSPGHPNGPRRSMSITKLKTVGIWPRVRWQDSTVVEGQGSLRGRVITGMLTGGDPGSDELTVDPDQRAEGGR